MSASKGYGMIGALARHRWMANSLRRRLGLAGGVALFGLLAVFPPTYRAAVTLTPLDPATIGVGQSANSSGLGALSLLGSGGSMSSQTLVETSLQVAHGVYVRDMVSRRLNLPARLGKSEQSVQRWLAREVDARSLRGGIIEIDTSQHDSALALDLIKAYADAIRGQMAIVNRSQSSVRQHALEQVLAQADQRLSRAQAAYDAYRLKTGSADPMINALQESGRVPALDDMVAAKQAEIQGLSRFATDGNFRMRKAQAELAALQSRADNARSNAAQTKGSVGRIVAQTSQGMALRRELELSQMLYEGYKRNLQGTLAEALVASVNIRLLEAPYLDPDRQYNTWALLLLALWLAAGLAVEFYLLRPPFGERRQVP